MKKAFKFLAAFLASAMAQEYKICSKHLVYDLHLYSAYDETCSKNPLPMAKGDRETVIGYLNDQLRKSTQECNYDVPKVSFRTWCSMDDTEVIFNYYGEDMDCTGEVLHSMSVKVGSC